MFFLFYLLLTNSPYPTIVPSIQSILAISAFPTFANSTPLSIPIIAIGSIALLPLTLTSGAPAPSLSSLVDHTTLNLVLLYARFSTYLDTLLGVLYYGF